MPAAPLESSVKTVESGVKTAPAGVKTVEPGVKSAPAAGVKLIPVLRLLGAFQEDHLADLDEPLDQLLKKVAWIGLNVGFDSMGYAEFNVADPHSFMRIRIRAKIFMRVRIRGVKRKDDSF